MSSPLNTPTSVAAATHTFTISAANNRALVVLLQTEGTQTGTMTMTYGGISMINVVQEIAGSGTTQQTVALFFLNDAGIVSATGTTLAAGNYGTTDLTIHAASYQDCVQTTPTNYDTDTSSAATPNPLAALDITTGSANSVVVAGSGMGNAGSAAWGLTLTERTDQAAGSSNGSLADDSVPTATTIACECTWTTQNRACAVAFELVHLAAEGITSIDPTTFDMDNGDIDINGVNFLTPIGSGEVYLSDADTLAGSVNEVDITSAVNTWSDTVINLDLTQLSDAELADLHTLGPGQRYIIVVNNDSDEYGSTAITLHRPEGFVMSLGAGTPGATTARLTPPATKVVGDFDAGRFEEAANPAATVDITADDYTEMVWSMEAKPLARDVAYQFRVTIGGVAIDDYTVTPQMTISGGYTMTAESGSYSLTGTAVDLLRNYYLSAASGAFALTGTAVDLLRGYHLIVDSGSYEYVHGPEILTDGDLENWTGDDLDDWTEIEGGSSAIENEQAVVQSGSNACRVSIDVSGTVAGIEQTYAFQNGTQYAITLYLRKAVGSNNSIYLWDDDAGAGGLWEEIVPPAGVWTKYRFVWTANANSDRIRIRKGYQGTPTAWVFYLDNISVVEFPGADTELYKNSRIPIEVGSYDITGQDVEVLYGRVFPAESGRYFIVPGYTLGSDILVDPGFEDYTGDQDNDNGWFNEWSAVGTADNIVDPTATVHGGSNAVKFIKANPDYPQYECEIYADASPDNIENEYLELKYWTRGDGGHGQISAKISGGGLEKLRSGVTGTTYTEVTVYLQSVTDYPYIEFHNEEMFSTAYVDDASIKVLTHTTALRWNRLVDADSGSYAKTGTDVDLLSSYSIDAESGSYVLTDTVPIALTNADFESYTGTQDDATTDSFTDWTIPATDGYVEATATVQSGSNAVKMYKADFGQAVEIKRDIVSLLEVGGTYELTLWCRGDGHVSSSKSVWLEIRGDDVQEEFILGQTITGVNGTTYVEKTYQFTYMFANTSAVLNFFSTHELGLIYLDNVSLKRIDQTNLFYNRGAIDIESGAYAKTGTAVDFPRTYYLEAESGIFLYRAIPPTGADLYYNRYLEAESGAYTKTGQDVTLDYSGEGAYKIDADSGSYSLTGTDVDFPIAYKLTAESGSYAKTGTAVDLLRGYPLEAESGSYAQTGTAVDFLRGYVLDAESGTYTQVGQAVTLVKTGAYELLAEAGAYAKTGTDVGLRHNYTLECESGSYAQTGTDATLTYTPISAYFIDADSGLYGLTGTGVDLLRGYDIDVESGLYGLAGTAIDLLYNRLLDIEAGSYAATGQAVELIRKRLVTAAGGSFALTGIDVDFARSRVMSIDSGQYNQVGWATGLGYSGEVAQIRRPTLLLLGVK